jgi:alkylation response protein AidB-like acyl-CoA dehydrogenase
MADRSLKRKTFGKMLINHQTILFQIAEIRIEIDLARLLTLKTA